MCIEGMIHCAPSGATTGQKILKRATQRDSSWVSGNTRQHKRNASTQSLKFVIFGLSITSSWGNGHATTYRGLVRGLVARGHEVLFLERNLDWYAANRDLPQPPYGCTVLYDRLSQLKRRFASAVENADCVIVGSYVHEGAAIGEWVTEKSKGVTAFYDIDTPVTVSKLVRAEVDYLTCALIPRYQLYLSFTGGPILGRLERDFGSPMARPLYCSVDPLVYHPQLTRVKWDLGYMGTYSSDRQPSLENLLLDPARRWSEGHFIVAGPQFPKKLKWPRNVRRVTHLSPARHRDFYNSQKFTLNVTRTRMVEAGYSPSVRLFEAAACGTPIISDYWEGLETFFEPEKEILIANSSQDSLQYLRKIPETERGRIGERARARVLAEHTAEHRAAQLEGYVREVMRK